MLQYLSSMEDLLTLLCFLAFQEIKEGPKKTQNPVINLQVTACAANQLHKMPKVRIRCSLERKGLCIGILTNIKVHEAY